MSSEARQNTELQAIERAQQSARSGAGGDVSLEETYSLYAPLGSRDGMSICGSPSRPAMVARHGGTHSALAVFVEPIGGAERTWTVYLEREVGVWRVRHFHLGLSAIGARDGAAFRDMATVQARAGNNFNATILYDVAAMLLVRGANFQPAEQYGLAQERSSLERHPDIAGEAPYTFHLGEQSFAVSGLTVTGTGDQHFILLLDQFGVEPVTDTEATVRNRLLIDAMNEHRPEWREAFDALATSYPTSANTVWRTVYTPEAGYLADPEAGAAP
jgi:hypothetical protein